MTLVTMPCDLPDGWRRLHPATAPDAPPSERIEHALARVDENGKARRVRQIRFCPDGPWFTVADDADLGGVVGERA